MLILLKLTLSPFLVAGATLGGRRWGTRVSGWLAGFPIVAGPVLFFFAIEHSRDFAAQAAQKTLLGLAGFAAFAFCYAHLSRWFGPAACILLSWSAFILAGVAAYRWQPPLGLALGLVTAILCLAWLGLPHPGTPGCVDQASARPGGEMLLRMGLTLLLVFGLTAASGWLGPGLSGVLAPFPIASTVMVVFAHRRGGWRSAAHLLSGSLLSMLSLAGFCACLALCLPGMSLGWAFAASLAALGLVQGLVFLIFLN